MTKRFWGHPDNISGGRIRFVNSITHSRAEMMLSHEKLDVYQRGIEFLILATDALNQIPSGHGEIKKQLRKASLSILLNIAEASGKTSDADRQNFYAIGRGSAHECAALLDALAAINAIDKQDFHHGKDLLHDLISMLTKMARPD